MPANVLVIEDNPANLELMVYLLNAFGHRVESAGDGEAGLEMIRARVPDLVICDIHMPGLDGYGVASWLKSHPQLQRIPLIAVTALAMVGDRDRILAAGFDGYLTKPIDPEEFVGQIEHFLRYTPAVPELPVYPDAEEAQPAPEEAREGATLLVVDDWPVNLELARSIFEPRHYRVLTAPGAEQALSVLEQTPPDLILCDLHMPGTDGYQLLQTLKADPRWSPIPFILVSSTTGWPRPGAAYAHSLGAAEFIVRPIDPDTLLDTVQACLSPTTE